MPSRGAMRYAARKRRAHNYSSVTTSHGPDNAYLQTSIRRHEFNSTHHTGDLAADAYIHIDMVRFKRSYHASTADVLPTPTSGNNYQSSSVMNGSRIRNFQKKIIIQNANETSTEGTAKSFFLDVYEIVGSFWDMYIWEDFDHATPQTALIDFEQSSSSVTAGEVTFKTTHETLTANNVKNSKFTQRYLKLIGRVRVDAGKPAVLNINRLPPKCRRSNSGMFYGLVLHNNSQINGAEHVDLDVGSETYFEEEPNDVRLPFVY